MEHRKCNKFILFHSKIYFYLLYFDLEELDKWNVAIVNVQTFIVKKYA